MEQPADKTADTQCKKEESPERRKFLTRVALGLGGLMGLAIAVPPLGFLFWPVRRRSEPVWRPVGRLEDFPEGATVKVTYQEPESLAWAGFAASSAAYVRRVGPEHFMAFSAYCTHTACPVNWVPGAQLFLCPCHGGAFHADGTVAAGPPPTPLPQHEVRVRQGQVEIKTRPTPLSS